MKKSNEICNKVLKKKSKKEIEQSWRIKDANLKSHLDSNIGRSYLYTYSTSKTITILHVNSLAKLVSIGESRRRVLSKGGTRFPGWKRVRSYGTRGTKRFQREVSVRCDFLERFRADGGTAYCLDGWLSVPSRARVSPLPRVRVSTAWPDSKRKANSGFPPGCRFQFHPRPILNFTGSRLIVIPRKTNFESVKNKKKQVFYSYTALYTFDTVGSEK